jgi:cell division protease FtsH
LKKKQTKKSTTQYKKLSRAEKIIVAYHECGHAIVAEHFGFHDRIVGITRISKVDDPFIGDVERLQKKRVFYTRSEIEASICIQLAGRAAEILTLPDVSDAVESDLSRATMSARYLVMRHGMSNKFPPIFFDDPSLQLDELTKSRINKEIQRILDRCFHRSKGILKTHRRLLHDMAKTVIVRGRISGNTLRAFLARVKKQLPRRLA